jgi:hypothetical protein
VPSSELSDALAGKVHSRVEDDVLTYDLMILSLVLSVPFSLMKIKMMCCEGACIRKRIRLLQHSTINFARKRQIISELQVWSKASQNL